MTTALDGTFDFCASCSQHNNCCVRTRHAIGQVANPPLLPHEGKIIADATGLAITEFTEDTLPPGNGLAIKRAGNGCYFYINGKCGIYAARPLDCRIFPFDIREIGGELRWVVYLDLCPVRFSYEDHFLSAKQVLWDSHVIEADLRAFARHGREIMAPHRFELLEAVVLSCEQSRSQACA